MTIVPPEYLQHPRLINFPDNKPFGWIDVREWQDRKENQWEKGYWDHATEGGEDWRRFGEARGNVSVPAGIEVRFRINRDTAKDLSFMSELWPNDLQVLSLANSPVRDNQLHYLSHLSGLHTLNLWATSVTFCGFKYLQRLHGLKHLAYSPADIHNGGTCSEGDGLTVLRSLVNLETLYLYAGQTLTKALAFIEDLPQLRVLQLVNASSLDSAGIEQLSKISSLRRLGLPGASIQDEDLAILAKLSNLEQLDMSETDLSGSGFKYLQSIPRLNTLILHRMRQRIPEVNLYTLRHLPQLTRINYAENDLGETGLKHLACVPNLRELDLSGGSGASANLTFEGLEHLCSARHLEILKLSGTTLDENGFVHLSKLTKLRRLDLGSLEVTDRSLASLDKLDRLQVLDLWGTQVSDAGLAHLQGLVELQELHLAYTRVCGSGLIYLQGLTELRKLSLGGAVEFQVRNLTHLSHFMNLIDLCLHGQGFTNETLEFLQSLPQLQNLTLYSTRLDDAGLANLVAFRSLTTLNLSENQIDDAGLPFLAQVPSLVELDFNGTCVSDAGIGVLAQMRNLELLNLHNTQLTPKGMVLLRDLMPNCHITN